jgi:ribosomal RNA assembly protein
MKDFVRIPEERLKFLKREKKFKEQMEKFTESKIQFNEDVEIECEDSLKLWRIKQVIQAFGRGFDSDTAMNLLDEEYSLETIEIRDYSGKSRGRMLTLKGRVIGTNGKTKKMIENYDRSHPNNINNNCNGDPGSKKESSKTLRLQGEVSNNGR